jgi:hypothetical protein
VSESTATVESGETTFQTFDNFDDAEISAPDENDWSVPEAEVKESKPKDEGLKVLDDTEVDLDGKVVKEEGKKEAKKEKKEESFDDESEEEEKPLEDQPINEATENKESKKIRMRMGDGELYNVDSNSTFKVKVDGEMVDVAVQDLLNNYSGKTAWDKKFTEIGKEKKLIEVERNTLTKQKDQLLSHLNEALGPIRDKNKNPIDSLLYLVEMSGEDPYAAYRRIMEANLGELSELIDMSETERELFFHKKKDELHSNVNKKRQDKQQKEQVFNQTVQKVDALRQARNVTEDQFVDASEELEEIYTQSKLDVNTITDEAIVDYASLKPHIAVVKKLIEPYEENISESKYGDVVSELSRYLRDGKADEATVSKILKRNFSVEEEVKDLNTKVYQKGQKAPKKVNVSEKDSDGSESFDDWE